MPASETIQANPAPCSTRPGTTSLRALIRSEIAPATGATSSGVAVQGRNRSPVPSGESPAANWKNWLVRNAAEKMAALIRNWVPLAAAKLPRRKSPSGIIGSGTRASRRRKPAMAAGPTRPTTWTA